MTFWRLVPNPYAKVDIAPARDGVLRAWTYAPLRARAAIERETRADDEPELFALIERVRSARAALTFTPDEVDRLAELGMLVARAEIAEGVPVALPVTLERIESLAYGPAPAHDATWIVHPALERTDARSPPAWFGFSARDWGAAEGASVLSWREPGLGLVGFCQPEGELAAVAPALVAGEVPPVSARVREALVRLGVVVAPDHRARAEAAWDADAARSRTEIAARGWHRLSRVFTDVERVALFEHIVALQQAGFMSTRSLFSPLRYSMNGGVWMSAIHAQIRGWIERAVGCPVTATTAYGMIYEQGSDLPRHIDRPECDLVVSALLAYEPAAESPAQWPLYLAQKPDQSPVATNIVPGAGVLYEGRAIPHWRSPLPLGHRVGVGIFCYRREASVRG
jgi:hypothetical protein